jgi:hypothetical protein
VEDEFPKIRNPPTSVKSPVGSWARGCGRAARREPRVLSSYVGRGGTGSLGLH